MNGATMDNTWEIVPTIKNIFLLSESWICVIWAANDSYY